MKVAYFILNSFDYDSRARLEVETLSSMGHEVHVVVTVGGNFRSYLGCRLHRISQWTWPSRKIRFVQYNFLAARIGRNLNADIYHAVDLDTLQAAVWAAGKGHGKIVYEARELYTELEAVQGRLLVQSIWRRLERRLIGKAARVIAINDFMADELRQRYRIERPTVIRNVAPIPHSIDTIDLHSRFAIPGDWKILLYQGVLRSGQGLPYLLEILKVTERIALVLVGAGVLEPEIRSRAENLGIGQKVKFAGMLKPEELPGHTAAADAGVLLMEDVALNNRLALPQKLFQYLVCGIPQIVSPLPELSKFVKEEGTGLVVQLCDAPAAARSISTFLFDSDAVRKTRANCGESALRNNWGKESEKLISLYESLEPGP